MHVQVCARRQALARPWSHEHIHKKRARARNAAVVGDQAFPPGPASLGEIEGLLQSWLRTLPESQCSMTSSYLEKEGRCGERGA